MSTKPKVGRDGIYDARQLGTPKMLVLGFQHMFAMFGATVTVPLLTGLSISPTLLFAGLGTLLFHCLTKINLCLPRRSVCRSYLSYSCRID